VANRARDWLQQAERDLAQAESSRREGRHEWACFAAQQSAEKAVKALHLALGQDAWGNVVARLLRTTIRARPEGLHAGRRARRLLWIVCGTAFDTITGFPVPVDLLVYTEAEWEQLRAERASFVRGIEVEAVWVA
jgi:hypothetical protein